MPRLIGRELGFPHEIRVALIEICLRFMFVNGDPEKDPWLADINER